MNRRSFFSAIARVAAIVAIAPQIAFRQKLPPVTAEPAPETISAFWTQSERYSSCYSDDYVNYMKQFGNNRIPFVYKRPKSITNSP